jgi:hypothetical protein
MPSLLTVLLIVGLVMFVMSFWRQIAVFILFVFVAIFCFGVYYIITAIEYIA